jgi:CheY-like chemotaxis protein
MEAVNIHDIIQEIIGLLSHSLKKNIIINQSLNAKIPFIWGGTNQIQNAILNLAINARDAMPDGGTLTFATSSIEIDDDFLKKHEFQIHPGHYVSITITDTGTGMEPDILKHLFEPFVTTKEEGKGTGMGLAAVYGIVNSHKGGIEVQSKPGTGSTFTLYFSVTSKLQDSEIQTTTMIDENKTMHALVIDDEKLVAQTVKDIISAPGITVTLAYGGNEAVQIYKQKWREIDIVIIDMMMPDMDGRQTFMALKEINPSIKAIISSGYTLNQEIDLALKAGASAFLQKPYNRHELFQYIDTVLNKTTSGAQ